MAVHRDLKDKEKTQVWAQTLLNLPNFYVLDTETTGVGKQDEAVQIAVIDKQGRTVIDTLIKPTKPCPQGAINVHGITNDMLKDAPTWVDVYIELSAKLAASTIVAYNMDFDWRILLQTSKLYGLPLFGAVKRHCAMIEYARYRGSWDIQKRSYRWHKLSDACKFQHIKVENAHNALGDVRMTLELIRCMAG
jgi:DNA polymerase-3 subunit epsilon